MIYFEATSPTNLPPLDGPFAAALARYDTLLREMQILGDREALEAFEDWTRSERTRWNSHFGGQPSSNINDSDFASSFSNLGFTQQPPDLPPRIRPTSTSNFAAVPTVAPYTPPAASQPASDSQLLPELPHLAAAIADFKVNEGQKSVALIGQIEELIKRMQSKYEDLARTIETARSTEYSRVPEGQDKLQYWTKNTYDPATAALARAMQELPQDYISLQTMIDVNSFIAFEDLDAWASAMETAFSFCENGQRDWNTLSDDYRLRKFSSDTRDLPYQQVTQAEEKKSKEDLTITSQLSTAAASRAGIYFNSLLAPALNTFLVISDSATSALSQVLLDSVQMMPAPPDPSQVDNTPYLLPRASTSLLDQLNDAASCLEQRAIQVEAIYDRLIRAKEKLRTAEQTAELDSISENGADSMDSMTGYRKRSERADAQNNENLTTIATNHQAARDRQEERQTVIKPTRDRIVKWKADIRNELIVKGAQGPGGAAFVSGAFATQHAGNILAVNNVGSSNMEYRLNSGQRWG